jgi:hypothetical protein
MIKAGKLLSNRKDISTSANDYQFIGFKQYNDQNPILNN